jgi:hypothetical protein
LSGFVCQPGAEIDRKKAFPESFHGFYGLIEGLIAIVAVENNFIIYFN